MRAHLLSHFDANWFIAVLTAISMCAAGFAWLESASMSQEHRMTTVEAHDQETSQRLDRMEDKLDTIFFYVTGVHPTREDKACATCSSGSIPH